MSDEFFRRDQLVDLLMRIVPEHSPLELLYELNNEIAFEDTTGRLIYVTVHRFPQEGLSDYVEVGK